jgi:hypothetical protein
VLGEASLRQGKWDALEETAAKLEEFPAGAAEAAVLRAHGLLARDDRAAARALLEGASASYPQALGPRLLLSRVLLREGRDFSAAEKALREVLALEPRHAEARQNLDFLRREAQKQGPADAVFLGDLEAVRPARAGVTNRASA